MRVKRSGCVIFLYISIVISLCLFVGLTKEAIASIVDVCCITFNEHHNSVMINVAFVKSIDDCAESCVLCTIFDVIKLLLANLQVSRTN